MTMWRFMIHGVPVLFILGLATGPLVQAECVIGKPKPYLVALEEQPSEGISEIGCPAPPGEPCERPAAPTIESGPLAEEVVVQATIPTDYPAVVVWWRVQAEDPDTHAVLDLYETVSKEAVDDRTGSTVRMGLPGLRKGTQHWVSVGFCQDIAGYPGLRGCNCWSTLTSVESLPTFSTATPDEPPRANMEQKVEDEFRRPATSIQTTSEEGKDGDGVGPNAVWEDGFDGPTPDGAFIGADEDSAVVSNGLLKYARAAKDPDSYAATRFWITDANGGTSDNYNIEIAARHTGSGAGTQFYVAKLVWNQLNVTDFPWLTVLDETQINPLTGVIDPASLIEGVDYIKLSRPGTVAICPGMTEDTCTTVPPLTSGTNRVTNSVVMQISAWKDTANSETVITGAVGWDCPSATGTRLYDCSRVCCLEKRDPNLLKLNTTGRWFIFGHHSGVKYNLEWFRAGDASTGAWP